MSVEVELLGAKFARVSAELRAADPRLQRKMGAGLRKTAEPMKYHLMHAAGGLSFAGSVESRSGWAKVVHGLRWAGSKASGRRPFSGGGGGNGLRSSMANSLMVSVVGGGAAPGVKIRSVPGRMPTGMGNIPAAADKGKWRHPVMGNRRVWAAQTTTPGWFTKTGPAHFAEVQASMGKTIDEFVVEQAARIRG